MMTSWCTEHTRGVYVLHLEKNLFSFENLNLCSFSLPKFVSREIHAGRTFNSRLSSLSPPACVVLGTQLELIAPSPTCSSPPQKMAEIGSPDVSLIHTARNCHTPPPPPAKLLSQKPHWQHETKGDGETTSTSSTCCFLSASYVDPFGRGEEVELTEGWDLGIERLREGLPPSDVPLTSHWLAPYTRQRGQISHPENVKPDAPAILKTVLAALEGCTLVNLDRAVLRGCLLVAWFGRLSLHNLTE